MNDALGGAIDPAAWRDPERARLLLERIWQIAGDQPLTFMEVCGTHTMNIGRFGIRSAMPGGVRLISGPGCPVCVTPTQDIDRAIELARTPGVIVTTFGDMMRVPGSASSLAAERAGGRDVRMVYSPLDAVQLAQRNPASRVVFLGVGFETTAPTVAASILEARARGVGNFYVLSMHKLTAPALRVLAADASIAIDGFILPGHVSTVVGESPYRALAADAGIPGVITGFEPLDILAGIAELASLATTGRCEIANAYPRGVAADGNPVARDLMRQVFEPHDTLWRGLGTIPCSGLGIRQELSAYDALERFDLDVAPAREPTGCRCGDILRGALDPVDCPLFGRACTPEHPVGPCMVSSEGGCAAARRFWA